MNNVKLLHIKCCVFQIFNSPVALKNKNIDPPCVWREKWSGPSMELWSTPQGRVENTEMESLAN